MSKEQIIREDTVSIRIELERVQKRLDHMQSASEEGAQQPFSEEFKAEMAVALGNIAIQVQVIRDTVFPQSQ